MVVERNKPEPVLAVSVRSRESDGARWFVKNFE